MKKILILGFAVFSFAACGNNESSTTETTTTDSVSSSANGTSTGATTGDAGTTTSSSTYTSADGDVSYRNNKVQVYKGGEWVDADRDITLDNGVTVYRDGRVRNADNVEVELHEGEVINRTGNFFDKSGNAIANAWSATKEGAKDAGSAIKEGARDAGSAIKKGADKVGEKVEKAVDHDNDGH